VTDWATAAGMLLSGVIVGFMIVYSMRRDAPRRERAKRELDIRDLEAKRDSLIAVLRELADEPANAAERARLEREAAEVLRQLDGMPRADGSPAGEPAPRQARDQHGSGADQHGSGAEQRGAGSQPATPSQPASSRGNPAISPRNPALAGFLWGALSVAALAGLGWFVIQSSKPRAENEPLTGAAAPAAVMQSQQGSDAALRQLEESVKAKPDDLSLRDDLAKAYLDRENLLAVFRETQYVLDHAPEDPRALTYQALVRMSMGQKNEAAGMLQRAVKNDPDALDGYVGLAFVSLQLGRAEAAEAAIREAARRHPEQQARLSEVFEKMKAQIKPSAEAPPPSPAGRGSTAGRGEGSSPSVHVTLQLAPGITPPPGGVIFVIVRAAGQTAGPPAAAKRLPLGAFPIEVDLTAADSMMGQPLPDSMRVEARIDSDGNAMTRDPRDPSAVKEPVRAGERVSLVLK
jgi:cytochrome c-type biogenesis protein CcmH/NrfG